MRQTTVTCDKCGETIDPQAPMSTVEATAGNLRARFNHQPVELCDDCANRLVAWLADKPDGATSPVKRTYPPGGGMTFGQLVRR